MDRPNKIYWLAATFMILAPLSVSKEASEAIKYARLGVTVLMAAAGIFLYSPDSFRSTTKSFVTFSVFFTLGALWSGALFMAAFNKGMYLMAVMGGIYLAYTTKSAAELAKGIKILCLTGTIAGFFLFVTYLQNPEEAVVSDRLAVGGMNANIIGSAAAPMFILSFFLGLWQPGWKWKALAFSSATLLLVVILGTGSRGATLMAIAGTLIATKPFLKKRATTLILAAAIPLGLFQVLAITTGFDVASKIPGLERIASGGTKENTREKMWKFAYKKYNAANPAIGIGWLHWGGKRSANCHNLYLQVLVEVGILGAIILAVSLGQITLRTIQIKHDLIGAPNPELSALPMGLLASLAVHGMVESSTLFGTTAAPMLLGFSIGLLDQLPKLLNRERDSDTPDTPAEVGKPAVPRLEFKSTRQRARERAEVGV